MQRLRRAADLRRNRCHRRPTRTVLGFVIQNQPHSTRANLGGELVGRFARHGSTFSRVGASDQPGAVHLLKCTNYTMNIEQPVTNERWASFA